MNQIKRKLTFNQSSNEETKKSRNEFSRSITCIENLPNEFFYEIFDYLDNDELYDAFTNLNDRFQQLLNSSSVLFKLHYSKNNESYTNNYQQFILLNKHKILSIKYLRSENNHFFSSFTINSSLSRLESLVIELYQSDILLSLLMKLACLPRLFSLTIDTWNASENLNDIYQLLFALSTLKQCRFIFDIKDDPISLPMATNEQQSPIEYFSIYHPCTLNELFTILSYTPQLRYLKLFYDIHIDTSIESISPITLSNLTDISIPMADVKFDEFKMFFGKINANLKILRLRIHSQDIAFLNARRWEKFILKSLFQLEEFHLQYDELEYPIYPGGPNQFTSSFWIKRQWTFEAEINFGSIRYFIHPYRKRWYEYTPDKILNSSVECSNAARITIRDIYTDAVVMRDTARVLNIAQIYHLEMSEEKLCISRIIKAVSLLPELNTLKIHSLSLYEPRMLNSEELFILSTIEDISKITKVYLEKMYEIKEFDFLLELCPYMEYYKVNCLKHTDLKFILRYIFKKLKQDDNDYLRLLCFCIPTADDEMIKKLKRMIHFEKLLLNYTIKRVADNIFLEWTY